MAVDYMQGEQDPNWQVPTGLGVAGLAIMNYRGLGRFAKQHLFKGGLLRAAQFAARETPGLVWAGMKRAPGAAWGTAKAGYRASQFARRVPYALQRPGVPEAIGLAGAGLLAYGGLQAFSSGPSPTNLEGTIRHTETPDQMPGGMSLTPHQMQTSRQAEQARYHTLAGSTYGVVQGLQNSRHGGR